jgi:hypothetical protein
VATVGVFSFPAGTELTPEGANRYVAPQGATPVAAKDAAVHEGALEAANQDVVQGSLDLVVMQRQAEMMQRALTVFHTEFNKFATEDLPKVFSPSSQSGKNRFIKLETENQEPRQELGEKGKRRGKTHDSSLVYRRQRHERTANESRHHRQQPGQLVDDGIPAAAPAVSGHGVSEHGDARRGQSQNTVSAGTCRSAWEPSRRRPRSLIPRAN